MANRDGTTDGLRYRLRRWTVGVRHSSRKVVSDKEVVNSRDRHWVTNVSVIGHSLRHRHSFLFRGRPWFHWHLYKNPSPLPSPVPRSVSHHPMDTHPSREGENRPVGQGFLPLTGQYESDQTRQRTSSYWVTTEQVSGLTRLGGTSVMCTHSLRVAVGTFSSESPLQWEIPGFILYVRLLVRVRISPFFVLFHERRYLHFCVSFVSGLVEFPQEVWGLLSTSSRFTRLSKIYVTRVFKLRVVLSLHVCVLCVRNKTDIFTTQERTPKWLTNLTPLLNLGVVKVRINVD